MSESRSPSPLPRKRLPINPSEEHLRKQAKRRVRLDPVLELARAQFDIAREYGCKNWAELMHVVETMNRGAEHLSGSPTREQEPLPGAVNQNDIAAVRTVLASGQFTQHDLDLGLARAVLRFKDRSEIAEFLIENGADPDGQYGANYGPIVLVTGESLDADGLQFLIDHGADVTFAPVKTKYGNQCPMSSWLGTYLRGRKDQKHRGIELLLNAGAHVPVEVSPALLAIHRGDAEALAVLLDQDRSLVTKRFTDMPYGNIPLRGGTLLHAAAEFDELECCGELINRGADCNAPADISDRTGGQTPVFHCVNNARLETTLKFIQAGAELDRADVAGNTPLWLLCGSWAPAADRLAVARLILQNGAGVRRSCKNQSTALHQAARHGPVEMVELLLRNGAREWQADKDDKRPIDDARHGDSPDRQSIIELLDRPVIRDSFFKSAVRAIHAGDLAELQSILKQHPNLIHDRAMEPDCYPPGYFSNPKLIWFVANNPTLMPQMPANIAQLTEVLIDAGAEMSDLNYTLELVMTGSSAKKQGLQLPLMEVLLDHGAEPGDLLPVLGHWELEPVKFLLGRGYPMSAPIAAAFGKTDDLKRLITTADRSTVQAAFGIAVINKQLAAARICLDTGADVNAWLPVHSHSTPAHQAAVNDDVEMLRMLVDAGASLDIRDTLWNATPLNWAIHTSKPAAISYLRAISTP